MEPLKDNKWKSIHADNKKSSRLFIAGLIALVIIAGGCYGCQVVEVLKSLGKSLVR